MAQLHWLASAQSGACDVSCGGEAHPGSTCGSFRNCDTRPQNDVQFRCSFLKTTWVSQFPFSFGEGLLKVRVDLELAASRSRKLGFAGAERLGRKRLGRKGSDGRGLDEKGSGKKTWGDKARSKRLRWKRLGRERLVRKRAPCMKPNVYIIEFQINYSYTNK